MRIGPEQKSLRGNGAIAPTPPTNRRRSAIPADRARGAAVTLAADPARTSEPAVCSPAHSKREEN